MEGFGFSKESVRIKRRSLRWGACLGRSTVPEPGRCSLAWTLWSDRYGEFQGSGDVGRRTRTSTAEDRGRNYISHYQFVRSGRNRDIGSREIVWLPIEAGANVWRDKILKN